MGEHKKAIKFLDIAVQSNVAMADAYYHLGMCYLKTVEGNVDGMKAKRREIESLFKRALHLDNQHGEASAGLAKLRDLY